MNLLYIANVRMPTEKAHGAQIMKTCEAFARAGAMVELVVPTRKNTLTDEPFGYYGVEKNFRLSVLSVPDFIRFGPLGFALSALWFSEAVRLQKSFWKAEAIYCRDAFVLVQYALLGRPLVYEAHTKPTLISRIAARFARKVVVISDGLKKAYEKVGIPAEKILVAHDAIDLAPFSKVVDKQTARTKLSLPQEAKIALYVGRIDEAKGVSTFAEASEKLQSPVETVIIGGGPLEGELKSKFPKAQILPATPYRDLPSVLATADVLVIPNSAKDIDASIYTSPLKLFAYMASGIPILAADVPALREILTDDMASFFTPDDATDLATKISEVLSDPTASQRALHAKEAVKNYTWDKRAESISTFLSE